MNKGFYGILLLNVCVNKPELFVWIFYVQTADEKYHSKLEFSTILGA